MNILKNKIIRVVICLALFLVVFYITNNIYDSIQDSYSPVILNRMFDDIVPKTIFSLITSFLVTTFSAFVVLRMRLKNSLLIVAIVLYVSTLLIILFGKSVGVSNINLNPFSSEVLPSGFILNIIVFVPAGFLLQVLFKKPWKAALLGLCISIVVEILQFIFSLGITDTTDVLANFIGILIGTYSTASLYALGFQISKRDNKVELVKAYRAGKPISKSPFIFLVLSLLLGILSTLVFVTGTQGLSSEYEDEFIELEDIGSNTLFNLPYDNNQNKKQFDLNALHPDFIFNNIKSGYSWINSEENNLYSSKGTIDQIESWNDVDGKQCFIITLCCRENVDNVTVIHGIPIVITENTHTEFDGDELSYNDLKRNIWNLYTANVDVKYRFEKHWISAEKIIATGFSESVEDDVAVMDFYKYDNYLKPSNTVPPYLSLNTNDPKVIKAHLTSITELEKETPYCTIQFYGLLNGAPIIHSVNLECGEYVPKYPKDKDSLSKLKVVLKDEKLWLIK